MPCACPHPYHCACRRCVIFLWWRLSLTLQPHCELDAPQVAQPELAAKLSAAASAIYSALAPALQDASAADAVAASLAVVPAVWVGTGFVEGVRCALSAPEGWPAADGPAAGAEAGAVWSAEVQGSTGGGSGAGSDQGGAEALISEEPPSPAAAAAAAVDGDLRPLLWVVPAALAERHAAVLTAAGAAHTFGAAAYAAGLQQLAVQSAGAPLSGRHMRMALRTAEGGAAAVAAAAHGAAAAAAAAATASGAQQQQHDFWLPDESCVMAPAQQLHYNDAPWLLDGAGGKGGMRMVHAQLGLHVAEALGARSVRWVLACEEVLGPWVVVIYWQRLLCPCFFSLGLCLVRLHLS